MTFLNPFVLFGLAAAAIPILIHLFNIRKLRTIEFSTLQFLKELNRIKIRRIKIRQWLLLALRTLLILLIVLAFSRPALKGSFGASGSRAATTVVILIDNSPSMQLHNGKGTFIAQAQQRSLEILSTLQENDELYLLRLSDLPKATMEEPTKDFSTLSSLIRETEIGNQYRTIDDGLRLASRLLQQSRNFNKEVYIITDGQHASLMDVAGQKQADEKLFLPNVRIFLSRLSQRQDENVSIERTAVPPSLLQINKPFTLKTVVKNHGTNPVKNHLVTVTFDNAKVMQKSVSLDAGETTTIDFLLTPYRSGFIGGYAELEDDPYEPDNRWYFTVNIPATISVTLVSPEDKYSTYVSAALAAARSTNTPELMTVTSVAPSQLTTSLLMFSDVLILSGVRELSASQGEILKRYIAGGGRMIFFPASDTAAFSYRYLSLLGISNLSVLKSVTSFDKVDLDFPVFQGMFEEGLRKKNTPVESPSITLSLNPASESNLRSIISQSNGKNFLWQRQIGAGMVIGFSVPATDEWSDFPMKGIFVPLLYQSVLYLASPVNTGSSLHYSVGEQLEFSSSELKRRSEAIIQLFDPEQRNVPLKTYVKSSPEGVSNTIFSIDLAEQAGIYLGRQNNDTVIALGVNIRREESDLTLAESGDIDDMIHRLGIDPSVFTELKPDANIVQTISESRFGIELWRYVLLAAILVALIEMLVAREPKQEK